MKQRGFIVTPLILLAIKVGAVLLAVAAVVGAYKWHANGLREEGRAEVRAEVAAEVQAQAERNRDLQRAAELRYTVVAETRDRFVTKTITEVRYETKSLAACPVPERARGLLNAAAACAGADSAAPCGPGEPVHAPR